MSVTINTLNQLKKDFENKITTNNDLILKKESIINSYKSELNTLTASFNQLTVDVVAKNVACNQIYHAPTRDKCKSDLKAYQDSTANSIIKKKEAATNNIKFESEEIIKLKDLNIQYQVKINEIDVQILNFTESVTNLQNSGISEKEAIEQKDREFEEQMRIASETEATAKKVKNIVWIVGGVILVTATILIIRYFVKRNKNKK